MYLPAGDHMMERPATCSAALLAAFVLIASEAARADHPLITEDTGVLGAAGRWQLELHGERAHDRVGDAALRRTHASATLARGVSDRLDVQLDLPWGKLEQQDAGGRIAESGVQDVALAAKWRFYENGGFSAVLKPELWLPTGRDEAGLGAGRARWVVGIAAAQEWRSLLLIGHARYTANRNRLGEREALRHTSVALLWAATGRIKLVLDYGRETSPDPGDAAPVRELVYGLLYAVSEDVDLGIGYQQGRSAPAEDRVVRAGIKLRW